jgi:hypothetical protein
VNESIYAYRGTNSTPHIPLLGHTGRDYIYYIVRTSEQFLYVVVEKLYSIIIDYNLLLAARAAPHHLKTGYNTSEPNNGRLAKVKQLDSNNK